jgi:HK97 family phage portal protein
MEARTVGLRNRYLNHYERGLLNYEELATHPFFDLIQRPNNQHEKTEFILKERTEQHLSLTGNAYWLIIPDSMGIPRELWILQPDRMAAVLDKDGILQGWSFLRDDGGYTQLATDEVIHFKLPSPTDDIFGWSLVKAGAYAHDTQTFMGIYHKNFFRNSARPDYILTSDNPIGEEQAKAILAMWKAEFMGSDRAHLPAILGMGLKPMPLQLTNTDIQFMGIAQWTLEQLVAIYGVPKAKLGLVADFNRSNSDAADQTFNRETIRPEMLRIVETIKSDLLIKYPQEESAWLDLGFPDPVPEDREFELEKRIREWQMGIRTLNEARDAGDLDTFDPALGDRIHLQMQDILVPIDASAEEIDGFFGLAQDGNGGGGGGQEPEEGEGEGEGEETDEDDDRAYIDALWNTQAKRTYWWYSFVTRSLRGERKLLGMFKRAFRKQHEAVIAAARELFDTRQLELDEPTIEELIRKALGPDVDDAMVAALTAELTRLAISEGETIMATIGIDEDLIASPAILQFLESKPIRVRGINDTTRELIRKELREWFTSGEAVAVLESRIASVFDMAQIRAENIARTEAIGALNAGNQAALEAGKVPYKQWLSSRDARVRDTHARAEGQIVRSDGLFQVGAARLEYPGDPKSNHPEEVCNCRCTTVPRYRKPGPKQ